MIIHNIIDNNYNSYYLPNILCVPSTALSSSKYTLILSHTNFMKRDVTVSSPIR